MLYVYFIQAGNDGPIKIGLAADPEARRADLQTGAHNELILRAAVPGSAARERELHLRFADAHLRGEWFRPTPELLKHVARAVQIEAETVVMMESGVRLCAHCGVRPVSPPRTRLCGEECEQERKRLRSAAWRRGL